MTVQSEFEGTTIDYYLKRYTATGILGDPARAAQAQYGDFTSVPTYQEAQNLIARTTETFEALPSDLRDRFSNDPAVFLDFVNDEKNVDECIRLGIYAKTDSAPSSLDAMVRTDTEQVAETTSQEIK